MNTENELRLKIDDITYVVSTHYAKDSAETITDKITRLLCVDEIAMGKAGD